MATLTHRSFRAEQALSSVPDPPAGQLTETEFAFLVEAPLPGVRRGEVSVEVAGDELLIRAAVRRRCRTGLLRWRSACAGDVGYRLPLGTSVEPSGMEVRVLAGCLSVRIPKTDKGPLVAPERVIGAVPATPAATSAPAPTPTPAPAPEPFPLPSPAAAAWPGAPASAA
jgi:HSP20 family protein